ncbi:hypothetical protein EJB05_40435, partial [Eragrostis curvula]
MCPVRSSSPSSKSATGTPDVYLYLHHHGIHVSYGNSRCERTRRGGHTVAKEPRKHTRTQEHERWSSNSQQWR